MVMFGREALDPEIREAVSDIPDFVFSAETVPMMRQNAVFTPVAAPDIERVELTTEPDGGVSMTMLRPRDEVGNLPVLYWMHGGGMVIGNRFMDDARLGAWCRLLLCVCVSVEYRLAPEAPYPAPIDDCDQGLRYVPRGRCGADRAAARPRDQRCTATLGRNRRSERDTALRGPIGTRH